jgi:hypothetical protein
LLEVTEVTTMLGVLGESYSAPERMLAMGDKNEDGKLTVSEFGNGVHHIRHSPTEGQSVRSTALSPPSACSYSIATAAC